ncbi:hypothetical protein [Mesorhizobium sangaii]|uniref:Uncharacterized protein n=1 Tax=Mesorhizobium sangaii TaxID=505389 RepID=A0A841P4Y1_9HYPH|nr:hypothetical protein [Mesorhizobium sangaii]MBB6408641.1 hypothetical protein [Mesorhizobium sangaii]
MPIKINLALPVYGAAYKSAEQPCFRSAEVTVFCHVGHDPNA